MTHFLPNPSQYAMFNLDFLDRGILADGLTEALKENQKKRKEIKSWPGSNQR